jgi:hypothetical protein
MPLRRAPPAPPNVHMPPMHHRLLSLYAIPCGGDAIATVPVSQLASRRAPLPAPRSKSSHCSASGASAAGPCHLLGVLSTSQSLSRGLLQSHAAGFAPTAAKCHRELPVIGSLWPFPGPTDASPRTPRAPATFSTRPLMLVPRCATANVGLHMDSLLQPLYGAACILASPRIRRSILM